MNTRDPQNEAYAVCKLLDANDKLREQNRRHKLTIEFLQLSLDIVIHEASDSKVLAPNVIHEARRNLLESERALKETEQ